MNNYNPDAPTENTAGFLQHTYQAPTNDSFYWNGMGGNFGGSMDGSRRNAFPMNPVNPMGMAPNPFAQFGQVSQNQAIPESAVQPFSSYPPAGPNQACPPPMGMGLNSMVESRRNAPANPTTANPWAPQQTQQAAPQWPTVPPTSTPNPYMGNPYDLGFRVDMNTMALYNNNSFGFDKHNTWDNYYTQDRGIGMPNINWNSMNNNNPMNQYYNTSYVPPQFKSINQFQTAPQSWKDIAEKNWASSNL